MRQISTERLVGPKPNLRTSAAWPCDPDSALCGDRGLTVFDWANLGLTAHLLLNQHRKGERGGSDVGGSVATRLAAQWTTSRRQGGSRNRSERHAAFDPLDLAVGCPCLGLKHLERRRANEACLSVVIAPAPVLDLLHHRFISEQMGRGHVKHLHAIH